MLAKQIDRKLSDAIDCIVCEKEKYVYNPASDFTRVRKISMKDTIRQILAMEGGSLKKEMYDFSQIHQIQITPSAFIQQRSKIKSEAFESILRQFNANCRDVKTHKGYRILAVDGSDINQFRDPDAESFVIHPGAQKGYNQTHLNALYDLEKHMSMLYYNPGQNPMSRKL